MATLEAVSHFVHPIFSQTLIHLIERKTKKEVVAKFYTNATVVYHHVNAFEDNGHVVFDVIAYNDNSLYDMFYLDELRQRTENPESSSNKPYSSPNCKRFVLPLSDKVCYLASLYNNYNNGKDLFNRCLFTKNISVVVRGLK